MSFFRAVTAATQAISGSTETALVFGTEVSDPDGVFASSLFTVPSGWNGRVGGLSAGFRTTTAENNIELRIQKQTGGVGAFVTIAENHTGYDAEALTVSAYPIVFATGDVYRVAYFGSATTKQNSPRNYFGGWVLPTLTKLGMFRARSNANQSIGAGTLTRLNFAVEDTDTHTLFDSHILTVPSDFNGGFLHLSAGALTNVGVLKQIYFEQSTDGGSTWTTILAHYSNRAGTLCLDSGPIAAVTGHKFRVSAFSGSGVTFEASNRTFFSGMLFKY